jgi:capsular exopolysaccharide synthesis family protein
MIARRSLLNGAMGNHRTLLQRNRPGADPGPNDVAGFENAYQVLRASLTAALNDIKQPRVMVTSPTASEGKTTTCVNLALSFAKAGQRVIMMDLDLRHPDAHRMMGVHNEFGLTDLLLKRRRPEECLQFLQLPGGDEGAGGVYFLASGPVTQNPAELLSMDRTAKMVDLLGEQADLMLIDTPPVLSAADALVVGRMVSGAVLVVRAHKTTLPEFGVVVNQVDRWDTGSWDVPGLSPDGMPPRAPETSA